MVNQKEASIMSRRNPVSHKKEATSRTRREAIAAAMQRVKAANARMSSASAMADSTKSAVKSAERALEDARENAELARANFASCDQEATSAMDALVEAERRGEADDWDAVEEDSEAGSRQEKDCSRKRRKTSAEAVGDNSVNSDEYEKESNNSSVGNKDEEDANMNGNIAQDKRCFNDGERGGYRGGSGECTGRLDARGRRRGTGSIDHEDGGSYQGQSKNDRYHGRGIFRGGDGDRFSGEKAARGSAPYLNAVAVSKGGHGLCRQRLDTSRVHMPEPLEEYANHGKCCTVCRWATGKKLATMLSKCDACGVHLCVWHFKLFHTLEDLQGGKEEIRAEVEKRLLARKPRTAKLFTKKNEN